MAMLFNKAATASPSLPNNLLKLSLNFIRTFSSSSTTTTTTTNPNDSSTSKKSKRNKKKNLFEVAQFLPNWGIGYHMAKAHWSGVSYQITKINLYKDGRHGKAWGLVFKNGMPAADAPKKMSGVHKRCWRYIPNLKTNESITPNSKETTESPPKSEPQAA